MSYDYIRDIIQQLEPHLSEYLESQGIDPTKKFKCIAPNHIDNTPSTSVNGNYFKCFGCGITGTILHATHFIEGKPAFGHEWLIDNLGYLCEKYGILFNTPKLTDEQIYQYDCYRAYKNTYEYIITKELPEHIKNFIIEKRKWDPAIISNYDIGCVPDYDKYSQYMLSYGFPQQFLIDIGLLRKDLFHSNNLLYTWKNHKKQPIAFVSRNVMYEVEKAKAAASGSTNKTSKSVNSKNSKIFKKSEQLFGIDKIDTTKPVYFFEGQADVITGQMNGINCVCSGGSPLKDEHIHLLYKLNVEKLILCFDGDGPGERKLITSVEQFYNDKRINILIKVIPMGTDPDSFILNKGADEFNKLAIRNIFDWKLSLYDEDVDDTTIIQEMVPYIASEQSAVIREVNIRTLSYRTGISIQSITKDVCLLENIDARKIKKARQDVLEQAIHEIKHTPDIAEDILRDTQQKLIDLNVVNINKLGSDIFIEEILSQKQKEEQLSFADTGFYLSEDLKELEDAFRGPWSEGVFICVNAKANHSKTSLLSKLSYDIANKNKNVMVIYHTIDDTLEQIVPRFICLADNSLNLYQNMVRQPAYWSKLDGLEWITDARKDGYNTLISLAKEEKLLIKDIRHGNNIPFIEGMLRIYREKYPDKRLVFVLDNMHKLSDFQGLKDERIRFKEISKRMKELSLRYKCCNICTVEPTKLAPGVKPSNNSIAESVQMEFDAVAILNIYNEVADLPDSFNVCHKAQDWQGNTVYYPRIEVNIGKNKITEIKKTFYLDFYPAASNFRYVNQDTVMRDTQLMKEYRKGNKEKGEMDDLYGD